MSFDILIMLAFFDVIAIAAIIVLFKENVQNFWSGFLVGVAGYISFFIIVYFGIYFLDEIFPWYNVYSDDDTYGTLIGFSFLALLASYTIAPIVAAFFGILSKERSLKTAIVSASALYGTAIIASLIIFTH